VCFNLTIFPFSNLSLLSLKIKLAKITKTGLPMCPESSVGLMPNLRFYRTLANGALQVPEQTSTDTTNHLNGALRRQFINSRHSVMATTGLHNPYPIECADDIKLKQDLCFAKSIQHLVN
jgi:hypothetical protein